MAEITDQDREAFRERGYVVIPDVLGDRQLAEAKRLVTGLLAAEPPAPGHVGFYFVVSRFSNGSHPLAGVWLSDQSRPGHGNLWVWPGTHLRFGAWLAERGAEALSRAGEMNPGPYPAIDLGEPEQVTCPAGSVLFAHYLLGHNTSGHDGPARTVPRLTVYYRLHARGHRECWRQAVTSPLTEFA